MIMTVVSEARPQFDSTPENEAGYTAADVLACITEQFETELAKREEYSNQLPPSFDKLVVAERGIPPSGLQEDEFKAGDTSHVTLSEIAGSIFHGEAATYVAVAAKGLGREIVHRRREQRHGRSPALLRGWAESGFATMPEIMRYLKPPEGYDATINAEPQLFATSRNANNSAAILNGLLRWEQERGKGEPGPIEELLKNATSFQPQGRRTGNYTRLLRDLSKDDLPISKAELKRHIRTARTHMFMRGGNLIACPTSRPDILEFAYKNGDELARQAAGALSNVLDKNIGFNPERLATETVEVPGTAAFEGGPNDETDALSAIHLAVSLIAQNRITPYVIDIKLQTHIGEKWLDLEPIWDECEGDLARIFNDSRLGSDEPEYQELRRHWYGMERKISATAVSFLSFLRLAEREYRLRYPDEHEPIIDWYILASRICAAAMLVDFDISKPGKRQKHRSKDLPMGYLTSPPVEESGIPKKTRVFLRPIPRERLMRSMSGRAWEMRQQLSRAAMHGALDREKWSANGQSAGKGTLNLAS